VTEVVRFSSQFSRCLDCYVWSGAQQTGCNQLNPASSSTCRGAGCAVTYGEQLVWGDSSCAETAWQANQIIGPPDFYPRCAPGPTRASNTVAGCPTESARAWVRRMHVNRWRRAARLGPLRRELGARVDRAALQHTSVRARPRAWLIRPIFTFTGSACPSLTLCLQVREWLRAVRGVQPWCCVPAEHDEALCAPHASFHHPYG
jgi:hypothetical protein